MTEQQHVGEDPETVVFLKCYKCGGRMDVPVEEFRTLVNTGKSLMVSHDECPAPEPDAPPTTHKFQVVLVVREILEEHDDERVKRSKVLAKFGARANGINFSSVIAELGDELNGQWVRVIEMAGFIDQDYVGGD